MRALRQAIRRPGGLARLFTLVYALAVLLAGVVAWQRPRADALIREAVDPPDDETLDRLRRAQREGRLGDVELDSLYAAYLRAGEPERFACLPGLAFRADPDAMSRRVRRTLAAGSPTQRARAALFAARAEHPAATRALAWGRDWNRRVRGGDSSLDIPPSSVSLDCP